jgi:hypothetical protein
LLCCHVDVVVASFWHIRMLRRQSLRLHDMPRYRRLVRLLCRMKLPLVCHRHQLHRHNRQCHSLPVIHYMMHCPQRILPPRKRPPDAHPRIPAPLRRTIALRVAMAYLDMVGMLAAKA